MLEFLDPIEATVPSPHGHRYAAVGSTMAGSTARL